MNAPRPKQSLAQDVLDSLLKLIWQKFYEGQPDAAKCFGQDRSRLLSWVILWPARFISGKGFTLPGGRYKQIFTNIILEAVRFGNTSKVNYRPAWLKMVLQSHFRTHWEEYYAEAKSARAQADHALHVLGQLQTVPDDFVVRDLSTAANLLAIRKPKKRIKLMPAEQPINEQLNLICSPPK